MADLTLRLSCGKSFDRRKPELGKNEGMLICDGGGKKFNNDCSEAYYSEVRYNRLEG